MLPKDEKQNRFVEVFPKIGENSDLTIAWRLSPFLGKTRSQSKVGEPSYGTERTGFRDGPVFAQDATFGGRVLAEERF